VAAAVAVATAVAAVVVAAAVMVAAVAAAVAAATGAAVAIDTDPCPPDRITHTKLLRPRGARRGGFSFVTPWAPSRCMGACAIMPRP